MFHDGADSEQRISAIMKWPIAEGTGPTARPGRRSDHCGATEEHPPVATTSVQSPTP